MTEAASWTEPGAHEVAPGVHRIPLPLPTDGLRAVNVYALESDEGLVLVDGGWAVDASRRRLEAALRAIGYRVGDITRFLVTHVHRDHYTQASVVRREVGAHVTLGLGDKATLDLLRDPDATADPMLDALRRCGSAELVKAWEEAFTAPDPALWEYPDQWLSGDVALDVAGRSLDALATPGHTQGHYVFADRADGLLFAGDHVLPTITPSVGFESARAASPLGDFLGSLAKVRALPDLRLLPAHGPVTESSHARIDELLAHHDDRLRLCEDAVGSGLETAQEVADDLPWTRRGRRLADLDLFNRMLAVLETAAHLDLLVAQDRLARSEVDIVSRYTRLAPRTTG